MNYYGTKLFSEKTPPVLIEEIPSRIQWGMVAAVILYLILMTTALYLSGASVIVMPVLIR